MPPLKSSSSASWNISQLQSSAEAVDGLQRLDISFVNDFLFCFYRRWQSSPRMRKSGSNKKSGGEHLRPELEFLL